MALFELLQESIRQAGDMANDAMENGKLKQKIRTEQKAVRAELQMLGEIYLRKLEEGEYEMDEEEKVHIDRINAHKRTIDECHDSMEALAQEKATKL